MGVLDKIQKNYFEDSRRFADVWNTLFFRGKVIDWHDLQESNTVFTLAGPDGVAEKIETETVEGAVKFETDKFSIYALARPVISQEIDAPLPDEVDPLGVFDEIPVAVVALEDTPVIDESELDVPDTGAMVRNVAVAVATYLPAVVLALAMAVFMRNRRWAEMRRRAQASFNGGA